MPELFYRNHSAFRPTSTAAGILAVPTRFVKVSAILRWVDQPSLHFNGCYAFTPRSYMRERIGK